MTRDNAVYVRHIWDAVTRIEAYTSGIVAADFKQSNLIQAAVIREIEIIGEASKKIASSFRKKHANIPWKKMAGMRDKLIHDYFGTDIEAVWDTVKNDLPQLKRQIEEILDKGQGIICS